jgi:hypothetical protein
MGRFLVQCSIGLVCLHSARAFHVAVLRCDSLRPFGDIPRPLPSNIGTRLWASTGGDEAKSDAPPPPIQRRRKRVRRRKDSVSETTSPPVEESEDENEEEEEEEAHVPPPPVAAVELKPRRESAVSLQVTDVRELVGGGSTAAKPRIDETSRTKATAAVTSSPLSSSPTKTDDDISSTSIEDPLEQMLADARQMAAVEGPSSAASDAEETGSGVGGAVRGAISALVTVDFFIVCTLLLWFLAGIFSSYVLQNDAVQIAFNGIFQPVVQPALGVLMIAAVADAVLKKMAGSEEEEEEM